MATVVAISLSLLGGIGAPSVGAATPVLLNTFSDLATVGVVGTGDFSAVSCPSAGDCVAVGEDYGSVEPMYAVETGGTWTAPVDLPIAGATGNFVALWCSSVTSCVAVGSDQTTNSPVVDSMVDGTWGAVTDLPVVVNQVTESASFTGVGCESDGNCVAVGEATPGNPQAVSASEIGGTWSSPTLQPETTTGTSVADTFSAVSCAGSTCVAVGQDDQMNPDSSSYPMYVTGTFTGGDFAWGVVSAVNTGTSSYDAFDAVSCPSVGNCLAIGTDSGVSFYANETGGTWDTAVTLVANSPSPSTAYSSVQCVSVGNCVLAGYDQDLSERVAVTETAGVFAAPVELTSATSYSFFSGIGCSDLHDCVAVGEAVSGRLAMYDVETAGSWGVTVEMTTPGASGQGQFTGVSCPSEGNCVAVGNDMANGEMAVATEAGGQWAPLIDVASLDTAGTFNAVSCPSVGDCVAVGVDTSDGDPLYDVETAGSWAAPVELSQSGAFNAVSCPSVGNCVAVGAETGVAPVALTLTEIGGTWGGLQPIGTSRIVLLGVSCVSVTDCEAVGESLSPLAPITVHETGGVWGPAVTLTSTSPSYSLAGQELNAVSCTSSGNCVAVGGTPWSQFTNDGFVATQTQGQWVTGSKLFDGPLTSVSCPTPNDCVAVGSTPTYVPTYVSEIDGVWFLSVTMSTPARTRPALAGASCPSVGACMVVGENQYDVHPDFDAVFLAQHSINLVGTASRSVAGTPVALIVSGASSVVAPSFDVTGRGCSTRGSELSATLATTCLVTAFYPAHAFVPVVSSTPVSVRFTSAAQRVLKVTATTTHGAVTVAVSGGSGRGRVVVKVAGRGCVLHGLRVSAARTTTCTVTATKAAQGVYAATTSKPLRVKVTK